MCTSYFKLTNEKLILFQSIAPEEQIGFVADVRQAIRFAQSDLKGKTSLPGLCLPKVCTIEVQLLLLVG